MKEIQIIQNKTIFEKGDILVMGWKNSKEYCEWVCELSEDIDSDEILECSVPNDFGVYTKLSANALLSSQTSTFVGGTCDSQEYFRLPTTEELVEFYKAKAQYYMEKAKA